MDIKELIELADKVEMTPEKIEQIKARLAERDAQDAMKHQPIDLDFRYTI